VEHAEIEEKWIKAWEDASTFHFDRERSREEVFSIDTPPPTVSGSLHVGHIFSYTHTDIIARYQRMLGKSVFYPMGWDDNGLPTERRVQNYFGVKCDPNLAYEGDDFSPPADPPKNPLAVSRRTFTSLCERLTAEDEKAFETVLRSIGLSVDWSLTYSTVAAKSRTIAQRGFLRNLARGEAYQADAPGLWDVTFQTAVAQAEIEARDYPGHFHRVRFAGPAGEAVVIETTRPELLPAVVALVAHPDDSRYRDLFGTTVSSPLFGVAVPIVAHPAADPEKGSGIAMCCTFGDMTDVQWWRELDLPVRSIIQRDGRLSRDMLPWLSGESAQQNYAQISGMTIFSARAKVVELLRGSGDLLGEPESTVRKTNFFEKGDRPLEIVASRQWYLTNGGRNADLRAQLLRRADELDWVPDFMRHRYINWVEGLNGDWLVSRQRFFGVPFPIWYRVDSEGNPQYDEIILPDESELPIDPASQCPSGFTESQRDVPGGFVADPDVMDTWATSSLTPQIVCGWGTDDDLFAKTFPMDMRPQAHEIIRTWLFSTIVRSQLEHDMLPWKTAAISGFVMDPDRKKMSKSKGNVVVPTEIIQRYGADAVRWRAASTRPGTDTPFDEAQMKVGRRLVLKLFNAGNFVLGLNPQSAEHSKIDQPIDRAMLAELRSVVTAATSQLEKFEYATALEIIERFFWRFCDYYIELVKDRAYGEDASESCKAALLLALSTQLRLFAPYMPFVTEELWSSFREGSIHKQAWPAQSEFDNHDLAAGTRAYDRACEAIAAVRQARGVAKLSLRDPVLELAAHGPVEDLELLRSSERDLRMAARVDSFSYVVSDSAEVTFDVRI
jgi:valyl-tRNA synthetase